MWLSVEVIILVEQPSQPLIQSTKEITPIGLYHPRVLQVIWKRCQILGLV